MKVIVRLGEEWPLLICDPAERGEENAVEVPEELIDAWRKATVAASDAMLAVAQHIVDAGEYPHAVSRAQRVIRQSGF